MKNKSRNEPTNPIEAFFDAMIGVAVFVHVASWIFISIIAVAGLTFLGFLCFWIWEHISITIS